MPNHHRRLRISTALLSTLLLGQPAFADDQWKLRVTPYLWAAGMDGSVSHPGIPDVEASTSFRDVVKSLDMGAMTIAEARRGQYGVLTDLLYIDLSDSAKAPSNINATLRAKMATGLLAGQYRVVDTGSGYIDLIGGARAWSLYTRIKLSGSLQRQHSGTERFYDPVIGAKGLYHLDSRTYLMGWIMTGGFGVGSDSMTDILASVGYSINDHLALLLGYRHLWLDYKNGSFEFDARVHGLGLGLDYRF